jgi:hypothetical protein
MARTLVGTGGGLRAVPRRVPTDVERLTARIRLLLEEAAHQGALALRLMVEARELYGLAVRSDDVAVEAGVRDLERRLAAAERAGRARVRRARLRIVSPGSRMRAVRP